MKDIAEIVIKLTARNAELLREFEQNMPVGEARAHLFGSVNGINTALDIIEEIMARENV
jgi:hypothetical protein